MNRGILHDLSGQWFAQPVDRELLRTGAAPELDHSRWPRVDVPGHWRRHPELADEAGPILYRRSFSNADLRLSPDPPDKSTRLWLCFDGVISGAEVWLDGAYLGDTVGYFAPHRFEITDQTRFGTEHTIAVDVSCPPGGGRQAEQRDNTSLTGSLQTGSLAPPDNPGGIWRPVHVEATGPVAIRHHRLLCTEAIRRRARLQIRLVVDSVDHGQVTVATTVTGGGETVAENKTTHRLAAGENRLEWEVSVDDPQLWWPHSLGDQPLYDVEVVVSRDEAPSDRRRWNTGFRTVEMNNFRWRINGEQMFIKGIAYGPPGSYLNEWSPERLGDDVALVAEAGLDMMRIHAHITRPEIYRAADRLGVLIWQDLPLIGGYSSKIRRSTKAIIREAVDLLGPHPSVMAWGGHVLPNGDAVELPTDNRQERPRAILRRFARHITPSWNRSVLDSIIGRELSDADPSRPIITRSASLPSPTDPGGSDAFLWFGWRAGLASDLAAAVASWPRLGAFPGGIGSQSVAMQPWATNEPNWATAERRSFDHYLPRTDHASGEDWAETTRRYQADLLEWHINTLRSIKYRPTGGFCLFTLADIEPEGGFGIVDLDRRPKPAWHRVRAACDPLVIIIGPLDPSTRGNTTGRWPVLVVTDLRRPLTDVTVTVAVDHNGRILRRQGWRGELGPDRVVGVADVIMPIPDEPGSLTITARLTADDNGRTLTRTTTARTIVV